MAASQVSAEADVRQTVVDIIESGSVYNIEKLDELYLDSMKIVHIGASGETQVLRKKDVLNFFTRLRDAKAKPLDTSAYFNHIEFDQDMAQVVVTRTMALTGKLEKSIYNLCLIKKEGAWKVAKETVVTLPA